MARKTSRTGPGNTGSGKIASGYFHPEDTVDDRPEEWRADRHHNRRARIEVLFDQEGVLGTLFGEFDANLVQIENRLGVFIAARGNRVVVEGSEDDVARTRQVLLAMHERLLTGGTLDAGAIEAMIAMSNEPTLDGIITGDAKGPPIAIRTRKKTITP
ncbi:MAG: PhoH-like protein, partial [Pseudomonadota bacterium]